MNRMITIFTMVFVVIFSSFITGCAPRMEDKTLTVGAASSHYFVFQEIGKEFEKEYGIKVDYNFGATGLLYQQFRQGGPMDVFASADVLHVDRLVEEGIIDQEVQELYARGRLVIISPGEDVVRLEDLDKENIDIIAIANPEHAPYGRAAKQALENKGIWEKLSEKIIFGSNLRDAQRYVESGEADAAIISLSMIKEQDESAYYVIDENLHEPIDQKIGVVKNAIAKDEAIKFFEFVTRSEKGKEIMKDYGFSL
ncbi:molybdate ABC transporter substrate-binding protein [Natranaerofaba carboxydovora]|uniref:molybdate ABC transporter substrate-binding protein n=1 Tax=Natranaerofaba carboxydovora TaxID=2742683 RepID=UPI001F13B4D5|nr:molybdate ABC transporter substrate-binding protein [Natranaerofaba carboxydovora]UMZ73151.1 Molybdate-binding periplasmic protein [Natranaerofaba carboxydovora]